MGPLADFHFLRPWWLLALLPAAYLAWRIGRAGDPRRAWRGVVAAHLLPYLLVDDDPWGGIGRPAHGLLAGWLLATLALAGPAWRREPSPFVDDAGALVVVLKVTPSMRTGDIQPDRLTRGVEKVRDLLALLPGARAALIAYAGSVHRVLPLTRDAELVDTFAGELSPDLMPVAGDHAADALVLADHTLAQSGRRGWILWIADAVEGDPSAAITSPLVVLGTAGEGPERASLLRAARALGARFVAVTPDDADIRGLTAYARFATADRANAGERWRDEGYWLLPPIAVLSLVSFRRGWMVRTNMA